MFCSRISTLSSLSSIIKLAQRSPSTNLRRGLSRSAVLPSNQVGSLGYQEKRELQARQIANDNPFDTYTIKPDAGSGLYPNSPIIIPSVNSKRIVGCCCEDDYQEVVWFELSKGETQKCDCGFYFRLIDYDPMDPNIRPTFGKGFGSGLGKYY